MADEVIHQNGFLSSGDETETSSESSEVLPVEEEKEEERTLTDHLNKRLLESFLNRLDSGSIPAPPLTPHQDNNDIDNSFDDDEN
jgi:hypothetical protein